LGKAAKQKGVGHMPDVSNCVKNPVTKTHCDAIFTWDFGKFLSQKFHVKQQRVTDGQQTVGIVSEANAAETSRT